MHVTVPPSAALTPAAAPGPAMKWMWATMGVLGVGVGVGALGAALVLRQPPAAQAQAPHSPIAGFSDQKVPEALMDKAQSAINNVAQGPAARAKPPAGPVDPIAPQRAATHPAMRTAPATPAMLAAVCLRCGQVVSVQAVQQAAPPTGVGAVAGGVLGAVVGNQVGKGNGRAAATLLGAVGGGYVGHKVEERTRTHTVYQIAVRMDDGSMRRFQRAEPVAVGMPVVLQGQGFRVDPDGAGRAAETTPQPHRATVRVADAH